MGIASIKVNGVQRAKNWRGFNFVVLSGKNGALLHSRAFDTHGSEGESKKMVEFINSLGKNDIILIAIRDEATYNLSVDGQQALNSIGATVDMRSNGSDSSPSFRMSFAMMTKKSKQKPSWFAQKHANRKDEPIKISKVISLPVD